MRKKDTSWELELVFILWVWLVVDGKKDTSWDIDHKYKWNCEYSLY